VIALVTYDAIRLPCGLVLPTMTAELPLTLLADGSGDAVIGDRCLAWTGPAGPVVVRSVREWAPAHVRCGRVAADEFAALSDALPAPAAVGIDAALVALIRSEPTAAVAGLLGRGPGLTPAGDDVLAGFLLGARAFGLDGAQTRAAIAVMAAGRTTELSAALLWHAARGDCIPEVAAVLADPSGSALAELLRVGHTSGAALAIGLSAASASLRAGKSGEAA
jgi:hypothetical protein